MGEADADDDPKVELDGTQLEAVDYAVQGHNIFLTGVAGTGKSLVTQRIIASLRSSGKKVSVAASTGVAAVAIGGATLHSLAGSGVPKGAKDFGRIWSNKLSVKTWKNMDVLVLDEVGMLAADFLEWLDHTIRDLRGEPSAAFGGIQLIFVGNCFPYFLEALA